MIARLKRTLLLRAAEDPVLYEKGRLRRRLGIAISWTSWAVLLLLIVFWGIIRFGGDRWWPATLMLFGPLWVAMLPPGILIAAALLVYRRALIPLVPAMLLAVFAINGMCLPWSRLIPGGRWTTHLRVMTCNVHQRAVNTTALLTTIARENPDVVFIQEWSPYDPPLKLNGPWTVLVSGETLIASRLPIRQATVLTDPNWSVFGGSAHQYELITDDGTIPLIDLHLASPHMAFAAFIEGQPSAQMQLVDHLAIRAAQSRRISAFAGGLGDDVILAGDFNTIAQGSIYHESWSRFSDAFAAGGFGIGHTYFGEGASVRIDHILLGPAWRCENCWVDASVGSPHHPLIADLAHVRR